jgi:uncharacterized protein
VKQFFAILCGLLCLSALAAEVIPPAPAQYFNDYAGVVSSTTAAQLNQQLEQFERDSSCQIVVAVYPTMQSDSSIDDYTVRVFQSWKVGQKDKNNGALLLVFTQDRKMFLQTGYGLEGALPDITCKRIIENEIKPHFKAGDYDAGLAAGVNAILAAAKGEYKGTGQTDGNHGNNQGFPIVFVIIFVIVIIIIMANARRGGYYSRSGWSGGGWGGGGGGWGGGGGGGGGGFSGGGGSTGGGGAGGSW